MNTQRSSAHTRPLLVSTAAQVAARRLQGAVITVKQTGERWRVREADNAREAWNAICYARARGSVSVQDTVGPPGNERIVAHVSKLLPSSGRSKK